MSNYKIYTDGSSNYSEANEDGNGGWGYVIVLDDELIKEDFGHINKGTVSKSELTAIFQALTYCENNNINAVDLYTDSMYCVQSLTNWYKGWQKRGWKKSNGDDVKHQELIKSIIKIIKSNKIFHVKGHSGDYLNELADGLANKGRENGKEK